MAKPALSVVVSTYNRLDALRAVLLGYVQSEYRDFEVIVADDGSLPETGECVHSFASQVNYPLRHVWQQDEGFRLAAVRNLGVRAASGEILVFTDGDCVPFPDMLSHHARHCAPGVALAGGRCDLEPSETAAFLAMEASSSSWLKLAAAVRRRELARLTRTYWKSLFYRATRLKARPKWHTANASVHRSDFEAVNGFDERFEGWGYEDEDLARRLRRSGVRVRDASTRSLLLHLFHKVHVSHQPSARGSDNHAYFKHGRFLTAPVRGLHRRCPRELAVELVGRVPECLAGLGTKPRQPPEVSVVFGTSARQPACEVLLRFQSSVDGMTVDSFYHWLDRELTVMPGTA